MKRTLQFPLKNIFLLAPLLLMLCSAQTIDDKLSLALGNEEEGKSEYLADVNGGLRFLREQLETCYGEVTLLQEKNAAEEDFLALLTKVNGLRSQISSLENAWHDKVVKEAKLDDEGYAIWDQEETTLSQLIVEFGALDYLYIVPPDMAGMKLNMHSNIPIPREAWNDVLQIILAHNGVGVKQVNPYTRQLYLLKQDLSAIEHVASSLRDLEWIPTHSRVFYVLSPQPEQIKSVFQFFEKFADAKQTFVYQIGPKIALVASKEEVEKLLNLYQTVWKGAKGKVSKVVTISKMAVKEMEKILQSFFGETVEKGRPAFGGKPEQEGLSIFALGQGNSLVLIGQEDVVARAEKIVNDTEEQLQDPAEMTVYLYQCRNSNPEDLAKVLEKVYSSLLGSSTEGKKEAEVSVSTNGPQYKIPDGYPPTTPPLVVAPPPLNVGGQAELVAEEGTDHFIADLKTGNLLMVVRRDALSKIKDLLRKMDIPKKMVHIEVLLFEKKYHNQNNFGINMLKIGSNAFSTQFNSQNAPTGTGVLQFLVNKQKAGTIPAYDLAYSFLMTQEDMQLNATPSVTTVNQTPAMISIVEEISINNGAAPVDTNKGIAFEKSYTRSNYGIILKMTPTVHMPEEGVEEKGCITLQTNVTFDTTKNDHDDRPTVDRRHIENEVRVADGETIILGGLRRKATHDKEERIPFLGEIPGLGKFFGSTRLTSNNTEMFFFITPKIVKDPQEELIAIREEELKKRPGDIPEFVERLQKSLDKERNKFFVNSIEMFFGR